MILYIKSKSKCIDTHRIQYTKRLYFFFFTSPSYLANKFVVYSFDILPFLPRTSSTFLCSLFAEANFFFFSSFYPWVVLLLTKAKTSFVCVCSGPLRIVQVFFFYTNSYSIMVVTNRYIKMICIKSCCGHKTSFSVAYCRRSSTFSFAAFLFSRQLYCYFHYCHRI